jgi:hypothetical protein
MSLQAPANSKLKLARPGFGPALKRLGRTPASRCHGGCRSRVAVQQYARQPPRHYSRSRAAPAAQLSLKHVGLTENHPELVRGTMRVQAQHLRSEVHFVPAGHPAETRAASTSSAVRDPKLRRSQVMSNTRAENRQG